MRAQLASLVVTAALVLPACNTFRRTCPVLPDLSRPSPAGADAVEVRFLGVGGFLIRRGSDTVLTAPLYSNPTYGEVATQDVFPDQRLIGALLPPEADAAQAILVGHGHYDHLMDVPFVALRRARHAAILGNDAVRDVLAPLVSHPDFTGEVVSLQPWANDACEWLGTCDGGHAPWKPYPVKGSRVRVWTILSEHSPQFGLTGLLGRLFPLAVHLWRGQPLEPAESLPTRPGAWPEGTTLSYVIDFLNVPSSADDGRWDSPQVAFRVYFQDSGTRRPFGFPPLGAGVEPRVDLALVCAGGAEHVAAHPQAILSALRPTFALAHHWEDFFQPRTLPLPHRAGQAREPAEERFPGIATGDTRRFVRQMRAALPRGSEYLLACPDAVTRFVRRDGRWAIDDSSDRWQAAR